MGTIFPKTFSFFYFVFFPHFLLYFLPPTNRKWKTFVCCLKREIASGESTCTGAGVGGNLWGIKEGRGRNMKEVRWAIFTLHFFCKNSLSSQKKNKKKEILQQQQIETLPLPRYTKLCVNACMCACKCVSFRKSV